MGKRRERRLEWDWDSVTGPGRSELGPRRPSVPADFGPGSDCWGDDDDEPGSAGVREPRDPRPLPLTGAGAKPTPEQLTYLVMSDPRR